MKKTINPDETQLRNEVNATPEAAGQKKSESSVWQSVLMGGIPGIIIGAAGTAAVEAAASEPKPEVIDPEEPVAPVYPDEVSVADGVNDEMTFGEAFAAARAEVGPGGAFTWHGHVYSTYRADDPEWENMTPEQRADYGAHVAAQVHVEPYDPETSGNEDPIGETSSATDGMDPANENEGAETEGGNAGLEDGSEGEIDVHIVGVGAVETEDGSEMVVGVGDVDGMDANFIDTDGDGEIDTVLIDVDGDGQISEGEVIADENGLGISVGDLVAEAVINSADAGDSFLYDDTPDYTNDDYVNDADINSLA